MKKLVLISMLFAGSISAFGQPAALVKRASANDAQAQMELAKLYLSDPSIRDGGKSAEWLMKAAKNGNLEANFSIGELYEQGVGVPKNDRLAFALYLRAANAGYVEAQMRLISMYGQGNGVQKNEEEAYFWSLLAAGNGGEETVIKLRDLIGKTLTSEVRGKTQERASNWRPVAIEKTQ